MTWREEEESEEGKVKEFSFPKQVELFYKEKINSFWDGKKEILRCLKEKSDGFSLKEQNHLV